MIIYLLIKHRAIKKTCELHSQHILKEYDIKIWKEETQTSRLCFTPKTYLLFSRLNHHSKTLFYTY